MSLHSTRPSPIGSLPGTAATPTRKTPLATIPEPGTRQKLLLAATRVIRRDGHRHLTLAAVAREAGVSKGGLLYHFPSKEALVAALVEDGCDQFEAALETRRQAGLDWLTGYTDAATTPGELDELGPALLGALAENPALVEPARQHFRAWYAQARAEGGLSGVLALLVLDGLFIHQLLGIGPMVTDAELTEGLAALRQLAPPAGSAKEGQP